MFTSRHKPYIRSPSQNKLLRLKFNFIYFRAIAHSATQKPSQSALMLMLLDELNGSIMTREHEHTRKHLHNQIIDGGKNTHNGKSEIKYTQAVRCGRHRVVGIPNADGFLKSCMKNTCRTLCCPTKAQQQGFVYDRVSGFRGRDCVRCRCMKIIRYPSFDVLWSDR